MALTKIDLVEKITDKLALSKKESAELVESVLALIKSTLESGEDVKISGFGKFEVKHKADRRGRNPATGETINIGARRIVGFRASTLLRTAING